MLELRFKKQDVDIELCLVQGGLAYEIERLVKLRLAQPVISGWLRDEKQALG